MQDFPKKQAEQQAATSINLVQGHANDIKLDQPAANGNTTDLTIAQDFQKKSTKQDSDLKNIEMLQGQEQNTNVHFMDKNK